MAQKKKRLISKSSFACFIVAVLGVVFFVFSSFVLLQNQNSGKFDPDNFENRTYYHLEVNEVLGKKATDATKEFFTISETEKRFWLLPDVDFYTIPVGEDKYLLVGVNAPTTKAKLNAFKEGKSETTIIINGFIKKKASFNEDWYKTISGFSTDQIIQGYYFQETSKTMYSNLAASCSLFFLSAYVIYFSILCPYFRTETDFDSMDTMVNSAYVQEDLVLQQKLDKLYERYHTYRMRQKLLMVRLIFSFFMLLFAVLFLIINYNQISLRVISVAFIIWFIVEFSIWLINRSEGVSTKLQKKFPVRSNYLDIKKTQKAIEDTRKEIDDYLKAQDEKYRVDQPYIERN